jgi:ABC-type branched-subunit amino acid transport system substrate-binding protein
MIKNFIAASLLIFFFSAVSAQVDYTKQYFNGKDLFRAGKYNLAMETFKPLTVYDQSNPYSAYASFYFALAAYNQNYKAVAKDMLNQIKKQNASWDKMDEVNFWLAKIHMENHDYFQGLKLLSSIQDKKFQNDIDALKTSTLASVNDVETLKMMGEEYPKDEIIAKTQAKLLSKNLADEENKKQLETLIDRFKLKRTDFIPEAPSTIFKDKYSVSMFMPFMVSTLDPTPGKKRNQIILDYYEGVKMAVDTLNKQGINISLRVYDTERSVEKIKKLLTANEIKNSDVIVGPLFPEENKLIQDFSVQNKINTIHPFSNNTEMIGNNPYAYLYQPSSETLGRKSAEYLADHTRRKNCIIFYGSTKKDSVMMANFSTKAGEKGLKIVATEKFNNKEADKIKNILATPTEFDEFDYPKEFTLKKDSIGSIYVASEDPLIYSKVVSAVETRGDSVVIVGSENWIEETAVDLEKYQTLKIVLTSPNFASPKKQANKIFTKKYIHLHGKVPPGFAKIGYEFMMFLGNQLKTNGVYFQEGLNKAGVIPGYLGEGFNYQFSHDNQLVPFITLKKGEVTLIEKR